MFLRTYRNAYVHAKWKIYCDKSSNIILILPLFGAYNINIIFYFFVGLYLFYYLNIYNQKAHEKVI